MATVLYTALTELTVSSFVATWHCPVNGILPLDPSKPSTQALLTAGDITVAPPGSVDTCTPPEIVRGTPGLRVAVSN